MENKKFYDLFKIGEELPALEKETVFEGFQTPEILGGIELAAESAKAKEMAEDLGVGPIHTSRVLALFLCRNSFRK